MIHINRSPEPIDFAEFVSVNNPNDWNDFVHNNQPLYASIRKTLEKDQDGLSGYTELPLHKGSTHIDHLLKRDMFPKNIFDWFNFVVDDHNNEYGADYKDHNVNNHLWNLKLISPIKEDPQHFYTYQVSGIMILKENLTPEEQDRAAYTRDMFNLNHRFLIKKRAELGMLISDYMNGGLDADDIRSALSAYGLQSFVDYVLNNSLK